MLIRDLPNPEKPRERLIKYGVENLTNEDLLAIILRNGTKDISVKDLALEVMKKVNEISELKKISIHDLVLIKGIKEIKAITLIAAIELGRRVYNHETMTPKMIINNTSIVYNTFRHLLEGKEQEEFLAVYLDVKKRLIDYKMLFKGTIDYSIVHPRDIYKEAYRNSASAIIILHNHPSGDVTPSPDDIELTKQLKNIGLIMGIPIIDHLIIGQNRYYSFLEAEKL